MSSIQNISDSELLKQFIQGKDSALDPLILKHKDRVYTSIYMLVKDHELSDDLFQDTFFKVIDQLRNKKYNEEGKFLPWVLRIAHNLCMDHFRQKNKLNLFESKDDEYDVFSQIESEDENMEQKMMSNESQIDLDKYLDLLPEEQKEVIILRHYFQHSFKEIAEMMDSNVITTMGRMRYGLGHLRKMIQKNETKNK